MNVKITSQVRAKLQWEVLEVTDAKVIVIDLKFSNVIVTVIDKGTELKLLRK